MFVAQAIFPVCTSSCGSLTSNSWTLFAVSIALSSVTLISVQCSRGVVEVFLFAHCTLTAGLVIRTRSRNTLLDDTEHAFLGRQLLVVAPINLANTNIVMKERHQTANLFLNWFSFTITLLKSGRNCRIAARRERQILKREFWHDCSSSSLCSLPHWQSHPGN